jgi:response regulator RpfG family c-di-GMP phosphodiesterase
LKADAELKNIPVIMLTAESGKDNVVNIVKKGVKDYMVKPFKGGDLIERVRKIVPLDVRGEEEFPENKAARYFTQSDDVIVLALPSKITRPVTVEVESGLAAKIKDMAAAQLKKMVLDMSGVSETNVLLIKMIITVFQACQKASIAVKLVAGAKQAGELTGFQETSQIAVASSIEEARASL